MKKNKTLRILALLAVALPVCFSACVKDQCRKIHTYTYYTPVYKTKDEVRANIKSNSPQQLVNTGKLFVFGNYIFLNEVDKGVHVIDNSNPSQPRNAAFINIPGNVDIAVKGNILYADLYTDLVAIDISDPSHISVKKIIDYVFPERLYENGFAADSSKVVVDWVRHDTSMIENCDEPRPWSRNILVMTPGAMQTNSTAVATTGIGGSMARFTIVNDYMYAVDHHTLKAISISNPSNPAVANTISAGWDVETIYPFKDKLFVGSMDGLFIFGLSDPMTPTREGMFVHARACDPVIADDSYAYVTLRAGTSCGPTQNALEIVDISNLQSPTLVKSYGLTGPKGLSKDGNLLFICDDMDGLKVFDAANVQDLHLLKTVSGIQTFDVITLNKKAIVVAKDGLYQFDYSDVNNIHLLSRIATTN